MGLQRHLKIPAEHDDLPGGRGLRWQPALQPRAGSARDGYPEKNPDVAHIRNTASLVGSLVKPISFQLWRAPPF